MEVVGLAWCSQRAQSDCDEIRSVCYSPAGQQMFSQGRAAFFLLSIQTPTLDFRKCDMGSEIADNLFVLGTGRVLFGPFWSTIQGLFPTCEALQSAKCARAVRLWQASLRFNTAPAECEHKAVKDDVATATTCSSQCTIVYRSLCGHLHAVERQKGGASVNLNLRRQAKRLPGCGAFIGSEPFCVPSSQPFAICDSEPAAPQPAAVVPAVRTVGGITLEEVHGGNPKVM